ncbi:helix-turn-helix domain-containing protein [Phytomonospora sp. NPDC050363]|uniref:helix-turn-helix domain-containing protein n=1 Tax=Phytomonospora sp. NPDC050363 TaxID=3155642 RepID=UPI0033CFC337
MELRALGIDAEQERIYRHLVSAGPAHAPELAAGFGIEDAALDRLLDALTAAGLATRDGDRYLAAPPEIALRSLLVRRRDELGRAETALAELTELFRASAAGRSVRDLVEVVVGVDGVRQRFGQIQSGAARDLRAFVRANPMAVSAAQNTAENEAVQRGVRYRVVVEKDVLAEPGLLVRAEASLEAGEEIRIMPDLPLRMIIADGELGLVPLNSAGEPGAIVVHPSGLLDALIALFESTWDRALTLEPEAPYADDLIELDRRIIALLLQGFTDNAVAKQLDVSARTVQRRIRYLMDEAQVSTRMQLGYRLSTLGRLRPDGA